MITGVFEGFCMREGKREAPDPGIRQSNAIEGYCACWEAKKLMPNDEVLRKQSDDF